MQGAEITDRFRGNCVVDLAAEIELQSERSQRWPAVAPAVHFAGALGRVKGPLAKVAAGAPLARPARSRVSAITGATTWCVRTGDDQGPPGFHVPSNARPVRACSSGAGRKRRAFGHDFDQRIEV